jgi:hypothetical protein
MGAGGGQSMTAYVDTNVLIRHLTGEPPDQGARATRFLERADALLLPDLIFAEVAYALESFYELPREQVAETFRAAAGVIGNPGSGRGTCSSGPSRFLSCTGSNSPMPTW